MTNIHILFFSLIVSFSGFSHSNNEAYLINYGQVWGFLKYFHPEPSKMDWDDVLIQDYNQLKSCSSEGEFSTILGELISTCGDYKPLARNLDSSEVFSESIDWLRSEMISEQIRNGLTDLYRNKPKFKNKYISSDLLADNPTFKKEKEYAGAHSNEAIRFLALTRYWNVINYFYPNRSNISQNWNEVYSELLPDMLSANSPQDYELVLRRLSSKIEDGHGFVKMIDVSRIAYNYFPFYCSSVKEGTFINYIKPEIHKNYSIRAFDRIVAIDGFSIEEYWTSVGKRISASNDYYVSKSTYFFRQTLKDSIEITVERDGNLITEILPTSLYSTIHPKVPVKNKDYESFRKRTTGFYTDSTSTISYGYIDMGSFKRRNVNRSLKKSLSQVDHLIIDVRNYPNWTMYALGNSLIKEKKRFARFRKMNFDFPGSSTFQDARKVGGARKGFEGNVYILVDYMTMSQAEFTVMALQNHPNAVTIGGQTAGADGNLSSLPMPNGYSLCFSGLGVFYSDGTDAQKIGVKRDIEVKQTLNDVKTRRDGTFEKALELIRASTN